MTFIGAIFTPFYVTYIQTLNGSFLFAGSSLAFFSILTGILIYVFGKIESHIRNKQNIIALGYLVRGVAFLTIGTFFSNTQLIIGLIFLSIGSAMSLPAFDALYTRHVHRADSSMQWADLEAMSYIVTGGAALIGTILIQNFGSREVFILLGIPAFFVSAYVYFCKNLE